VTIAFILKQGVARGDAGSRIQAVAASTLPSTVATSFQGAAQAFQDSVRGLGLILVMAIVVIYIVLGVLYESFTQPLTILSGLPAAGFGALLTLLIFKAELSLYAFVGIIMLIGLVKKNGIMMVDFAVSAQRERGLSPRDAIHEACLVRFRPIMMTTMAAAHAADGARLRRAQSSSLGRRWLADCSCRSCDAYITPVYYVCIENARLWLARRRSAPGHGSDTCQLACRTSRAKVRRRRLRFFFSCRPCRFRRR
jgi:HAE1 family hydrophobic/amphiphilic exporter-1